MMSMQMEMLKKSPFFLDDAKIRWVKAHIDSMTEDEKIGQLFCLSVFEIDWEALRKYSQEYRVGGIMCRAMPAKDICEVVGYLQNTSKVPLLIASNLENGATGITMDATDIASNLELGAAGSKECAYKMGYACAAQGGSVGANWAFAPVVDIECNWRNPITGTRVFGTDPQLVAELGGAYIQGARSMGMASAPKHFPGDGMDERDQHLVTSINSCDCERWDQTYGKVYKHCIENGAMSIMVGHIMLPAYSRKLCPGIRDEEIMPATCAPELLQGLLRQELGFNGLLVTDDSNMAGTGLLIDRRKMLPKMIASGCDMLLFSHHPDEDVQFVKQGLREGLLTAERLDEAVMRILAMKAALELPEKKQAGTLIPRLDLAASILADKTYKGYADEIADKAVTLVKDREKILPLSPMKYRRIYLHSIVDCRDVRGNEARVTAAIKSALEREGFLVTVHDNLAPAMKRAPYYMDMINSCDLIVYVLNVATYSNKTTNRLRWPNLNYPIYRAAIPTMMISFANAYHLVDMPRISTAVNAYRFNESTVSTVVDKLMGRSPFNGSNPVDPFCGMWDTRL